jgi:hypothetical protein
MKFNKTAPLIATLVVAAVVGLAHRQTAADKPAAPVSDGEEFKLFVRSVEFPEGRLLTLVPWEEIQDVERFDELVPFSSAQRVVAVAGDRCAFVSRRTVTDRVNSDLKLQNVAPVSIGPRKSP